MLRVLMALCLAAACLGGPAQASFGDCSDPDYLGRFGSTPAGANPFGPIRQLDCVIEFEIAFSTPVGTRHIRGIRDINADWAVSPAALVSAERGARAAAAATALLGNFRAGDITILLLDDVFDTPDLTGDDPYVGALTSGAGADQECIVTSFLLGRGGVGDGVAYNIAHEIFHCIQFASLAPEQMATAHAGGDWWIEGSAEYFASLALPELGDINERAAAFNDAVADEVPLNEQDYGMAVFFHWFHAQRGPGQLMIFLSGMAPSSGAGAQHDAMRAAFSDEDWQRFAQDYSDRAITHPGGGALALNPPGGEALAFDGNVTRTLPIRPFVTALGTAEFDCGQWRNTVTPERILSAQDIGGGAWSEFPEEVDARSRDAGTYRIAALPTGDEREVRIEAERRESCQPCGGTERIDACLVGSWLQSGGGPVPWMRAQGMPRELIIDLGPQVMVMEDDGTYWTVPFTGTIHGILRSSRDVKIVRGQARAAAAGGRWSAGDGQLMVCQDSGGLSGSVSITSRGGTGTMPIGVPGGGMLRHSYSCGETSMETVLDFPGMSPMATQYTKISVDPPDPEPAPPGDSGTPPDDSGSGLPGGCPREDPDPTTEDECDRYRR